MKDVSEAILETIRNRLAELPSAQRRQALSTAITELLNSSGIVMDGGMVQSPLLVSPEAVTQIAALLSKRPTLTRNKYAVYPFVRPSMSASGPCFYMDARTGELFVLLLRRIKDSHQWLYPAGYMEVMPSNTSSVYSERVSESARNKAEEATIGVHINSEDRQGDARVIETLALPDARAIQFLIYEEFRRLVSREGWNNAVGRLTDVNYVRSLLARHRAHWPEHMDLSSRSTFIREVREESGLDLAAYPDAIIKMARSIDTISLGSGGERLYNTDQLYFAWLGMLEHAPALAPGENEVCEAGWIPVRDICYAPDKNQYLIKKDNRPLHFNAIPALEYALSGLLSFFIGRVSRIRKPKRDGYVSLFDNAATVQAALIRLAQDHYPAIEALIDVNIGEQGGLPSLVNENGQAVFRSFVAAAHAITHRREAQEINHIIANTEAQPGLLLEILRKVT